MATKIPTNVEFIPVLTRRISGEISKKSKITSTFGQLLFKTPTPFSGTGLAISL